MNNILNITSKLQTIEYIKEEISTTGFIFNKFSENYIITVHHGLPIKKCTINLNNLQITKDCIWNELLILKGNNTIYESCNIIKKCKYKMPKSDELLFIKTNDTVVTLTNAEVIYLNLFDIPTNPKNIYIKLDIFEGTVEQSMSGSPVFDKNNFLVGIFAKKNDIDRSVYIIPMYILIKSLTKLNNNSIYSVDYDNVIHKINNIKIDNNFIFHKSMNISIPISTYLMIEGDINDSIKINDSYHRFININDILYINNTNKIIVNNKKHEITSRLLKLIKLYFSEILNDVFKILKENFKNKIFLYINSKRIITTQNIQEFNVSFNGKDINLKLTFGEAFLK
jgi:hypothetical protein